jgi:hypothetical protein
MHRVLIAGDVPTGVDGKQSEPLPVVDPELR